MNRSIVLFYKKDEVKLEGKFVPVHTTKAQWEVDVWLCSFLIMAIDGAEWADSRLGHFSQRKTTRFTR
jgi:hypothetical protein